MRMTSPTIKGAMFLMSLLYYLHCNLFLAVRLLAVVVISLFDRRRFSAVVAKCGCVDPLSSGLVRC